MPLSQMKLGRLQLIPAFHHGFVEILRQGDLSPCVWEGDRVPGVRVFVYLAFEPTWDCISAPVMSPQTCHGDMGSCHQAAGSKQTHLGCTLHVSVQHWKNLTFPLSVPQNSATSYRLQVHTKPITAALKGRPFLCIDLYSCHAAQCTTKLQRGGRGKV